jgi:plasmid replication initiation protein
MAVEKQELVVRSNRLVEASYRLTLVEQQLVLYAICRSREEQRGLSANEPVRLDAKAFAVQFGLSQAHVYSKLKEAADALYERRILIHDIDPKTQKARRTKARWVSDVSYIDGAGAVEIIFGPRVIPHITRLEKEFTSFRLERIGHMTSVHAVRLYELLIQYLNAGKREMEVSWLKERLGLVGEYRAIKDFKKRVIDVAVEQINQHSDILVSQAQRKTGRVVTHLIFDIRSKPEPKAENTMKKARRPVINEAYIKQHARPGESYDQAFRRLLEEAGQERLVA